MSLVRRWSPAVVVGLALFALWWGVTAVGLISSAFLPSPIEVARRIGAGFSAGYLPSAAWSTLCEAIVGSCLAALVGVPIGYGVAKSRGFSRVVEPYVAVSQAVPAVAVAPLLVIWIGYGFVPITVLIAIMVMFPMIVATAVGVRSIDPDILGAARLDGAGPWTLARAIEIPLALPSLLAGLRTGFTLSITGAVVGEMIIGGSGLGSLLTSAQGGADVSGMFAVIVVMAALAVLIYIALLAIERRAARKVGSHAD